jgi:(R)-amidase
VTRTLQTLLVQLAPDTHDVDANVSTAVSLLDEHPEADLAVFPELFLQSYALRDIQPVDLGAEGELAPLADAARRNRTTVLFGAAERTGDAMANTAVCIDERGVIAASYRKVNLFGAERQFFLPGDEYVVAHVGGIAIGLLLCYDVEFPEAARSLAIAGAKLLVTLSANMDPYAEDHALFVRARALENGLPHVYVNCVGQEGKLRFCGGSSVADARGRLLAQLPAYRPEVRVVEIPVGAPLDGGQVPHYLADLRAGVPVRVAGTPMGREAAPR